jgi:uncharacterized protein YjbI with pentapeptide repeats
VIKQVLQVTLLFSVFHLYAYNPHHVQKLQQAVQKNEFVNASRCDFRGVGTLLKAINLTGAQLCSALFNSLPSVINPKPCLVEVSNQVSDLSNVNFSNATLVSTSFKNTILKGANFTGADISYADFTGADLTGAKGLDKALNERLALFCNTTMPDGTKPTGSTWTSSSGKVFYMRCSTSN